MFVFSWPSRWDTPPTSPKPVRPNFTSGYYIIVILSDYIMITPYFCLHLRIVIPLSFKLWSSGTVHGLAFWFDVAFIGGQ